MWRSGFRRWDRPGQAGDHWNASRGPVGEPPNKALVPATNGPDPPRRRPGWHHHGQQHAVGRRAAIGVRGLQEVRGWNGCERQGDPAFGSLRPSAGLQINAPAPEPTAGPYHLGTGSGPDRHPPKEPARSPGPWPYRRACTCSGDHVDVCPTRIHLRVEHIAVCGAVRVGP